MVPVNKAYRKGLWSVQNWPIAIELLLIAGSIWLAIDGRITYALALYLMVMFGLITIIWQLYQIGKWKLWMVENAENPKTTLEKARAGFLKFSLFENLALMGRTSRQHFTSRYDERMVEIRAALLNTAADKYDVKHTVSIHQSLSSTLQLLLFEFIVAATVIFLYLNQQDFTIRIISGALFLLAIIGIYYTLKSLWSKNKTVLEVSQHGIRIDEKYYGWIELEEVDIVKGDTLIYTPIHGQKMERKVNNLSMPADYMDELILFYKTTQANLKDNSTSS